MKRIPTPTPNLDKVWAEIQEQEAEGFRDMGGGDAADVFISALGPTYVLEEWRSRIEMMEEEKEDEVQIENDKEMLRLAEGELRTKIHNETTDPALLTAIGELVSKFPHHEIRNALEWVLYTDNRPEVER